MLVEDVKSGDSLGCSDHEMKFRILHEESKASRIATLDFGRANFGHFKDLLRGIPWVRALEGGGPRELVAIQASLPPCSGLVHPPE